MALVQQSYSPDDSISPSNVTHHSSFLPLPSVLFISTETLPMFHRHFTDIPPTLDRHVTGHISADCRPTVDQPTVARCISRLSVDYRSTIGELSVDYRPTIGQLSIDYRPTIGQLSIDYRSTIDRHIDRLSVGSLSHIIAVALTKTCQ